MPTTDRGAPFPDPGAPTDVAKYLFDLAKWISDQLDVSGPVLPTSGAYTPTLTLGTNAAAASVIAPFTWTQIGDVVTGAGKLSIDPVSASTETLVTIDSLPVPSDFTSDADLVGVATASWGPTDWARAVVTGYAGPNTIDVTILPTGPDAFFVDMTFQYRVLP